MRNITFRGIPSVELADQEFLEEISDLWQDDDFAYGSLIWNEGKPFIVGGIIEATDEYVSLEYWIPVKPETVGQYTEIPTSLVKDNKEIYDSDIVLVTDHTLAEYFKDCNNKAVQQLVTRKYKIKWSKYKWVMEYIDDIHGVVNPLYPIIHDVALHDVTYEVIGNVHQEVTE